MGTFLRSGTCHVRRSTCVKRDAVLAAYLRAAHAYMLISMPTGTSTILGVFQAILAFLVKWDELTLPGKLVRKEMFASEIFLSYPTGFMLQRKRNSRLRAVAAKLRRDNGFRIAVHPVAGFGSGCCSECRGEELAR